jgi:hypothetical protein
MDQRNITQAVPDRPEQQWVHPSSADWYYIFVGFCTMLLCYVMVGSIGLLSFFGLLIGYIQGRDGRMYYVLLVVRPRNFWIDKIQKSVLWEAEPEKPRLARLTRPMPPNGRVAINYLPFVRDKVETTLAIVYNEYDKTDTIIIGGEGSDIAGMSIPEQANVLDRVADGIKRLAGLKGMDIMVSFQNSRRPPNVREMFEIYANNIHPDFLIEERRNGPYDNEDLRRGDANIAKVLEECLYVGRDLSSKSIMTMSVTITRDEAINKFVKKGSLADDPSKRWLVTQFARLAEDQMTICGVDDAHAYTLEEMHEHIRYTWDVKQDDVYAGWKAENQGDLSDPRWTYFHWPQEYIHAGKDYCCMDGCWHAVLTVEESPSEARPDTFRPLYFLNVPNVTVSVVGKTVKAKREVRSLEAASTFMEEGKNVLGVVGETQASLERSDRTKARLQSVYHARYSQHYNIAVIVSATSKEALMDDVDQAVREVNANDGFQIVQRTGSFVQVPWVFSAHGCPM